MAYQELDLGTSAGDGTGDTIRAGGTKLNANFVELYTKLGTGTALSSGISATATIITLISPTIADIASFATGSAVAPSITKTGDTNTGLYFSAADALSITTGGILRTTFDSTGLVVVGDVTSTGTVEPAGDTSAGDNAAIGYTSAEGLILTGQGSTSDITLKNDADATVFTVPTGTDDILFPDNAKIIMGAGNDLQFTSTGSVGQITSTNFTIYSDDFGISNSSANETMLTADNGGAITLYYDNSAKLATTSTGVAVTGDLTATLTIQPADDTAAGDNAAIGYTSAEGLILTGQGSTSDITFKNDADGTVFTIPTGTDDILFPDNAKAMWGASSDLVIYHDGSDSHIKEEGTGDLYISAGDDLILRTKQGAETALIANDDGSVDIYYDNAVKFATSSAGVDVTGDLTATLTIQPAGDTAAGDNAAIGYNSTEGLILTGQGSNSDIILKNDANVTVFKVPTGTDDILFSDNAKAMWGAGSDLQIYHSGSHSFIDDAGTGDLYIRNDNTTYFQNAAGSATKASFTKDGNVNLYYNGTSTAMTAGSAWIPGTADGSSLGNAATEWSDLYLADSSIIYFGADQDVTLTHVADTGLLLNSTMKIQFNDASQFIHGSSATVLSIGATDEIDLTATAVDLNANLDVSGTLTQTGIATFAGLATFNAGATLGGNLIIPNAGNIGSASDTDAIAIASNGVVTFTQAPVFPDGSINITDIDLDGATEMAAAVVDADLFMIDDGAGGTMKSMLASRLKTYIVAEVGAAADNITGGDAAVLLTTSSGNITIDAAANDSDIILKGTDGGVDTTFFTIDGSAAGLATFNAGATLGGNLIIPNAGNIGSASDTDAIAIASNGVVTFSQIPVMPANSIDSDEYIDGSIDLAHMSANSIDSDQYVDGSIDRVHLAADIIDGTKIADDVLNSEHYAALSIDREHLAADIVDATKIADNAINSEHYVDGSIDVAHMAANSIDSAQYVDGSIDVAHMAANSIDSAQYVDGSIDTAHIAASQITLAKMATNSIDSDQYVDGSIDTAHYANVSITVAKMAANSIDSAQYVDNSIDEAHIANDAVGSAELKSLVTILIKNSAGSTLKTLYGAGA